MKLVNKLGLLTLVFSMQSGAWGSSVELYQLGSTVVKSDEVSPALKQAYFDAKKQHHETVSRIIDSQILENHIEELSKSQKKSEEEIRENLDKVEDPSEKEMKDWYEDNKARIPYPFDKIKKDIKMLLVQEKTTRRQLELIEKIKKEKKFKLLLVEPKAPQMDIITKGFATKGKGAITIVEFADYKCPHCKVASLNLKKAVDKFSDKVKFVYMDFPLSHSGISKQVALGAYCAKKSGKFWDFHYQAFENQAGLNEEWPAKKAKELGLDEKEFASCVKSDDAEAFVNAGRKEGERLGINSTPTIFVNGRRIYGYTVDELTKEIESNL